MFKTIALAGAIALSMVPGARAEDFRTNLCPSLGVLAEQVMLARQQGTPMSDLMTMIAENASSEEHAALGRAVILRAYGMPRQYTVAAQIRAAEEYRVQMEAICYGD